MDFSAETMSKAEDLLSQRGGVRQDEEYPRVWWVTPRPGTRYRVQVLSQGTPQQYPRVTCTCPNGMNVTPARCYHAAAVIAAMEEHL